MHLCVVLVRTTEQRHLILGLPIELALNMQKNLTRHNMTMQLKNASSQVQYICAIQHSTRCQQNGNTYGPNLEACDFLTFNYSTFVCPTC